MGRLVHEATGQSAPLSAEHTVGRSAACLLVLADRRASGHHALLRWTDAHWELVDLGSRNGVWVDEQRLSAGQRQVVGAGARLAFGDRAEVWTLADAGPPEVLARGPDGRWVAAVDGLLALPSQEAPRVIVYADDQERWVVECAGEVLPLELPVAELEVDGQGWTVRTPVQVPTTAVQGAPLSFEEGLGMVFHVSQDEEHVELDVVLGETSLRLPHRAQHYLLLTLARAYLDDAALGALASERGWRYADQLGRSLRIPENQFNVAIFRARQHLQRAGVLDAHRVVQRRSGSGQIRLGASYVRVEVL